MKVTVRMYRHGLGDCFLLIFKRRGRDFYMMIDCGVLQNLSGAPERLAEVAEDLAKTTGGKLDLLVMTHEHWDHISGFSYLGSSQVLEGIEIKQVWLSWLEDPSNKHAQDLEREQNARITALWKALDYTQTSAASGPGMAAIYSNVWNGIGDLLKFTGPRNEESGSGVALAAAGNARADGATEGMEDEAQDPGTIVRKLRATRDHIRQCGVEKPQYLKPGTFATLPGVEGVRVYVLGPPDDVATLHRMESKREEVIYQNPHKKRTLLGNFMAAVSATTGIPADTEFLGGSAEELQPFEEQYRIVPSAVAFDPHDEDYRYLDKLYGFGGGKDSSWRKIDYDWLLAAGSLALDVDGYTNNTSLVLAIELIDSGKVLLFPGDAQRGNWESWERYEWSVEQPDGTTNEIKIGDLLKHTVLYKVGHHGSHNATLSSKGLELMSSPELVAMIPVDEHQAREQSATGWLMPAPVLYTKLKEYARGRVLRDDKGIPTMEECLPFKLSREEYREFRKATVQTDLYIDCTISD